MGKKNKNRPPGIGQHIVTTPSKPDTDVASVPLSPAPPEQPDSYTSDTEHTEHDSDQESGMEPTIGPGGTLSKDYMTRVRPMIDLIDRLRHIGLDKDVGLPTIVVVGDQSAGKSSVLEAISGVQLPRGSGIVTRCPLELRLKRNDQEPWTCRIRYTDKSKAGQEVNEPVESPEEVGQKVREAQDALAGQGKGVSTDLISLEVEAPGLPDLTLIDLPGIVRVVMHNQPKDMAEKIKTLIKNYIKKGETIILAVIPANVDIETSEALQMAREVDPDHSRTLGVITKTDMVDKGAEDNLLSVLLNERYPLKKGYIAVKCRGQQAIKDNQTLEQALQEEERFFELADHFSDIKSELYGIRSLSSRLTDELVEQVQRVLPDLKDQVFSKRNDARQHLIELGDGIPRTETEKNRFLIKLVTTCLEDLRKLAEGQDLDLSFREELHIHNTCRQAYAEFARNISRNIMSKGDDGNYRAKVKKALENDRGRELPRFIKFGTFQKLAGVLVQEFDAPARLCLREVTHTVSRKLAQVLHERFKRFPVLESRVKSILATVIQESQDRANQALTDMFSMERLIFSQDETYNTKLDDLIQQKAKDELEFDSPSKAKASVGFLDIGESKEKEVDTMFTVIQTYMKIAVSRISDNVPLITMQHMLIKVVADLQDKISFLMEPGSGSLNALREEKNVKFKRDTLEAQLERLDRAATELNSFNSVV